MLAWRIRGRLLQSLKEGHNIFTDKRLILDCSNQKAFVSVGTRAANPQAVPNEEEELSELVPQQPGHIAHDIYSPARSVLEGVWKQILWPDLLRH